MDQKASSSQKIGFFSIFFFGINAVIASGIFLLPSTGYAAFGPASLLSLLAAGVLALLIALCFAKCASFYSTTGGAYLYAKDAFGDFVGFEVGFVMWAVRIIAEATLFVGFATALGSMVPALAGTTARMVVITVLGCSLMVLNLLGVRLTAIFSNVTTIAKLLPLALVIICGLVALHPNNFSPFFITKLTTKANFTSSVLTFFYVFVGFEGLVVAAGEMKDARRNLPKALLASFAAIAAIYGLVMVVCIGVLGSKVASSTVPLQDALSAVIGTTGAVIVGVGMLTSMLGSSIASTFVTPRSGVALATNRMMPRFLAATNRLGAPYVAIIISTVVGLSLAYSGSYATLAQISAVSRFAQYLPTILAAMVFRRKRSSAGFNLLGGDLIPVLALVISLWLLVNTTVTNLVWGLGALVVAVPFYFATKHLRKGAPTATPDELE